MALTRSCTCATTWHEHVVYFIASVCMSGCYACNCVCTNITYLRSTVNPRFGSTRLRVCVSVPASATASISESAADVHTYTQRTAAPRTALHCTKYIPLHTHTRHPHARLGAHAHAHARTKNDNSSGKRAHMILFATGRYTAELSAAAFHRSEDALR
jgi:hypothetical protein